jgi:hypothetical protein
MNRAGYLRSHPPRCLAGFVTREDEMPGVAFDGHGENLNTVFLISCRCGHDRHYVLGHYWREPDDDILAARDTDGTCPPRFLEKVHERARQKIDRAAKHPGTRTAKAPPTANAGLGVFQPTCREMRGLRGYHRID